MNLGRDHLRRRRRQPHTGPWLPAPVETTDSAEPPAHEPTSPATEARYDLVESVSTAFLLALEALTPLQRAVLLLRDVFDYSVRDTAHSLDVSEASVKTTLHRARRAMRAYDERRLPSWRDAREKTLAALEAFLSALGRKDVDAIESLLATDVRLLADSNGEYLSAINPIHGARNVARFIVGVTPPDPSTYRIDVRDVGGLPATLLTWRTPPPPRLAPRSIVTFRVDPAGKVAEIQVLSAPAKLSAVSF